MPPQKRQRGASAIRIILILAIIGVAAYIGIQYKTLFRDLGTVDSVLTRIEETNEKKPFTSTRQIRSLIDNQLDMNQMHELAEAFSVTKYEESYTINVYYERQLDLIYEKKTLETDKTITLTGE